MGINNTNKIQKKINKLFSFLMIKYKEVKVNKEYKINKTITSKGLIIPKNIFMIIDIRVMRIINYVARCKKILSTKIFFVSKQINHNNMLEMRDKHDFPTNKMCPRLQSFYTLLMLLLLLYTTQFHLLN